MITQNMAMIRTQPAAQGPRIGPLLLFGNVAIVSRLGNIAIVSLFVCDTSLFYRVTEEVHVGFELKIEVHEEEDEQNDSSNTGED